MPVVNRKAVESAIRIGLALNCEIAEWCRFARKNYFYPDMPKNFQTSQYDEPIAFEGCMDVDGRRRDLPRRDRARPHGGGHREVDPRGRHDRPHPRRRLLAGRLQPRRHPADRDRHQADPRHRGEGAGRRPRVRQPAARPDRRARRLRGPDGAGQPARRRQPLAGAEGLATCSAPAPRPRTSTRSARSSARCATRCSGTPASSTPAARSSRRPGTGTRTPASPPAAGRSRTPRTTATSPSPTWCRWRRRASGSRSCAARCRRTPPRSGPGSRPSGASPTSRCATPSAPARSAWSRRPSPPAPRRRRPASGGWASWPGGPTTPASRSPTSA